MSRSRHANTEDDTEIDLTPMLDVVFIMLIFFIVTASFIKESGLEISRPDETSETPPDSSSPQNVLVFITASSDIKIDDRTVDVRSVRSVIQRKLAENPEGTVIIDSHPEGKASTYAAVADAARQAKDGMAVTLIVKDEK